ncbi:MAG TPA: hypothetical protein VMS21_16215 [Methylomirabilota bacterium]|nr:hypothetical protein [Methylomirabilota bacterium]
MNVWELDKESIYILEGDQVVRDLLEQLRVPDLFAGVGTDQHHVLVAFDNHPTHWIIFNHWQGLPDYSPNHAVHRLMRGADPNGLLFTAFPKSSTSQTQVERKLKEFGADSEFQFSQFLPV